MVRRILSAMLARLDEPNAEVFAVFHPPGTIRIVTPAEHVAMHRGRAADDQFPTAA